MARYAICNELFHDRSLVDGCRLAAEVGYTGLEIAPFTLSDSISKLARQDRERIRSEVESSGLSVIGLHWLLAKTEGYHLTTDDREVREKTARYFETLVHLCADLGGDLMVLGSPMQRNFGPEMTHDQASKNAVDTIARFTDALEERKVTLAVEPLGPQEGNFLNHAAQARTLIQEVGSSRVRLHLDVKAMSTEGIPIDQVIRQNADLLVHFHANDPNRLGPGMGEVDFHPIFEALREIDYRGWLSVEVFDYNPGVEMILRDSISYMEKVQKSLGAV